MSATIPILDILFSQSKMFIKVNAGFVSGFQTLWFYQLKGLEPKNKDHTNFYECCDLTKEVRMSIGARKSLFGWLVSLWFKNINV